MNKALKSKNDNKIKIRTGFDLINEYEKLPEPKVLWNGIVEGACGLITGVGKTGKTTFSENLAIALAVGKKDFFGYKLDGIPRKVLFFNLEEKLWRIGRRNKAQISALNPTELKNFKNNYIVGPTDFPEFLNEDDNWNDLSDYIKDVNPDVLFIDSLTHMCIGEIEKSHSAQNFIQLFKEHISILEKTTFIIHHNTKGNDKPMTQDNIAGSRIIIQEFDFALGFGNIPTAKGGTYSTMLYNKDAEKSNNNAIIYSFDDNYRVQRLKEDNIFNLYKDTKIDGRKDDSTKIMINEFIDSKASQGSQTISITEFKDEFVENSTMSKQTLHDNLNSIMKEGYIERENKGVYKIN